MSHARPGMGNLSEPFGYTHLTLVCLCRQAHYVTGKKRIAVLTQRTQRPGFSAAAKEKPLHYPEHRYSITQTLAKVKPVCQKI